MSLIYLCATINTWCHHGWQMLVVFNTGLAFMFIYTPPPPMRHSVGLPLVCENQRLVAPNLAPVWLGALVVHLAISIARCILSPSYVGRHLTYMMFPIPQWPAWCCGSNGVYTPSTMHYRPLSMRLTAAAWLIGMPLTSFRGWVIPY
jgi:hypothetical protein